MKNKLALLILSTIGFFSAMAQSAKIITGSDQTEKYIDYLKNKRIGVLANPTSVIAQKHLVDSLLKRGIRIVKAFGPEHGFRGKASAGVNVSDEKDPLTGIKIVSLYGSKRKPSPADLADLDLMVFDIQDVGCRFYTYINVLRDVMEACAENKKELLILDRPNPNAYLIDGPVLDMRLKSGIGQFPVPIAHGMTVAEFALMINGEHWLPNKLKCKLKIIPVKNYKHSYAYTPPIKPSPNLNTAQSILLYPSTCLFEGTYLNHGRGTYKPFVVIGAPFLKETYSYSFVPNSIKGMSETPLFRDQTCYGLNLENINLDSLKQTKRLNLSWLLDFYKAFPDKQKFFDRTLNPEVRNFDFLAGDSKFKEQVKLGLSVAQIQASWEPELSKYKKMRRKYLLYAD
jgi:uncharacterized protein YbbC (DUF1343 family)